MMKVLKGIKIFAALILTLTFIMMVPLQTVGAAGGGMIALIGFGALILGGALGAIIAVLVNKNKKKKETA